MAKYTTVVMRAMHNAPFGLNKWKEQARKKTFWKSCKKDEVNQTAGRLLEFEHTMLFLCANFNVLKNKLQH